MHTFSYTPDPTNPHDKTTVTVSTDSCQLAEIVESFERYLRAAGFCFEGHLDITDESA